MTENFDFKIDSIAKDNILYADRRYYICLLKRYSYDKMTISGFMKGFYRIYHDGYRKWMKTSENFKELMLLDVNSKAIGFDSQVLKYWDHALEEVADDIRNSTFTAKRELAFRGWISLLLFEIQNYW